MKENTDIISEPNILGLTDFCKGLAISLVFLIHFQDGWFAWQGVHIFIVLSGFGLAYSCLTKNKNLSWKSWFIKRIRRILPAYWLVVLCVFPLLFLYALHIDKGLVPGFLSAFQFPLGRTILDLLLLRDFSNKWFGGPSGQLWFIPFIISCYLIFPFIYSWFNKHATTSNYLRVFLITVVVEFIYRAIAIYWLDGVPIGFDPSQRFLSVIPSSLSHLDHIPEKVLGMNMQFQEVAPLCFAPARVAEFTLGILVAFLFVKDKRVVNKAILNSYSGLVGLLIWLAGQTLIYAGLWGWIFGDFIIAIGLVLWTINLAYFCQKKVGLLFRCITEIGIWSYYVYLTHMPIVRLLQRFGRKFLSSNISTDIAHYLIIQLSLLTGMIVLTYIASKFVRDFDRSRFPDLIINRIIRTVGYTL